MDEARALDALWHARCVQWDLVAQPERAEEARAEVRRRIGEAREAGAGLERVLSTLVDADQFYRERVR